MDSDNGFKHSPLNLEKPSLRLIDLLPQQSDGRIRCRLRHVLLRPDLRFSAVSYEWGTDRSGFDTIHINEKPFKIYHNLFLFLTSLLARYPNEGYQSLWIDAISIDQQNTTEKNHQVRRMKQIFQAATNTLVWLGPAADDSDNLLDVLNISFDAVFSEKALAAGARRLDSKPWEDVQDRTLDLGDDTWKACEAFSRRSYWSRTWILQELLLSKRSVLFCGSRMCQWHSWTIPLIRLGRGDRTTATSVPTLPHSSAFAICEQWYSNFNGISPNGLVRLVLQFQRSICSIPHDKVYGLLGLASSSDASNFPVDYDCQMRELDNHLMSLLEPSTAVADARKLSELFAVERSFDQMMKLLNSESTISEVLELYRMFLDDMQDIRYLPVLKRRRRSGSASPNEVADTSTIDTSMVAGIVRVFRECDPQRLPNQRWEQIYIEWTVWDIHPLLAPYVETRKAF